MFVEHQLVPFHTLAALPGTRWLIFAPHADDECFGMGGSLLLARQQQIDSTVVFMTDGGLGLTDRQQQDATDIRIKEAQRAARLLGINKLEFLAQADRGLTNSDYLQEKIGQLFDTYTPDCIFIPAALELHPDHRMTSFIVWQAMQQSAFAGEVYAYEISVQGPINTLVDISAVAREKHQAMLAYQSQLAQNNYIEVIQALDIARSYTLDSKITQAEGFFKFDRNQAQAPFEQMYQRLADYNPEYNSTRQAAIDKLAEQIEQLKNAQMQLLNSTSWKLTRPLRWLKRMLLP